MVDFDTIQIGDVVTMMSYDFRTAEIELTEYTIVSREDDIFTARAFEEYMFTITRDDVAKLESHLPRASLTKTINEMDLI